MNIVESVTADGNTWLGIYVASTNPGAIVRRNTVLATGGSTHAGVPFYSIGIWNEDDSATG